MLKPRFCSRLRFECTGNLCVQQGERAIDTTAAGHHNLAGRLRRKPSGPIRGCRQPADLTAAIELAGLASAADYVDREARLSVRGAACLVDHESAELDRAMAVVRKLSRSSRPAVPTVPSA